MRGRGVGGFGVASLLVIVAGLLWRASCAGACGPGLAPYPGWEGRDLDCDDVRRRVCVVGADPHGLDADRDGVGCENW